MFKSPTITFSKTTDSATLPVQLNISDPGYILKSATSGIITTGEFVEVETGLLIEDIIKGVWAMILPLEDMENKHGITIKNKVINNSFRGELKISLYNTSNKGYFMEEGTSIAQIVYFPLITIQSEFKNESLQ
jgi:dUTPase